MTFIDPRLDRRSDAMDGNDVRIDGRRGVLRRMTARIAAIAILAIGGIGIASARDVPPAGELDGLRCATRDACALLAVASWEHGDAAAAARYFQLEAELGVVEDRHAVRARRAAEAAMDTAAIEWFVASRIFVHTGLARATLGEAEVEFDAPARRTSGGDADLAGQGDAADVEADETSAIDAVRRVYRERGAATSVRGTEYAARMRSMSAR